MAVFRPWNAIYFAKRMKNSIFVVCKLIIMGLNQLLINMFGKTFSKIALVAAMLLAGASLYAQDGAFTGFTPYSIFALGDIQNHGSAYNKGMGGVGIATRNRRYQNYMNPASITARDSISFMADLSLIQENKIFSQGDMHAANNVFNMSNVALSFPIYKSSAMMIGLQPNSSVGYMYSYILDDPEVIGDTGNAVYTSVGNGGTYKAFAAAGVTFFKRLSLGVEGDLYFGNITRDNTFTFAKSAYSTIYSGHGIILNGTTAKFGLQYEQPVGNKTTIGVGATYSLDTKLKGFVEDYRYSSSSGQNDTIRFRRDTLAIMKDGVHIPSELGLGISVCYDDNLRAEFNYIRSDWTNSGMDVANGFSVKGASPFSTRIAESFRAGVEFVPNRNDIRYYYKTCTYRAGFYYDKSYYAVDGNQVNDIGVTLGASLPVFRYYNAVTFAVSAGQRSSMAGNMIRERYVNFTIGINFFDYWFHKVTYN